MIFQEVPHLYKIIPLKIIRKTPGIHFDAVSEKIKVDGIDRVVHASGGISPPPTAGVARPWYFHPDQDDNLLVLKGTRFVDIYSIPHGKIESFEITPDFVKKDGKILFDGPAMLVWPRNVFHRIKSGDDGSISVNFATRYENFDIKTNFSIYDLDPETGKYKVIRPGHLDQPDD